MARVYTMRVTRLLYHAIESNDLCSKSDVVSRPSSPSTLIFRALEEETRASPLLLWAQQKQQRVPFSRILSPAISPSSRKLNSPTVELCES